MRHYIRRGRVSLRLLVIVLLGVVGGGLVPAAQAQEFGRLQEMKDRSNVAYFFHAAPGEATVQVSVWGAPQPGIYEVSDTTALDELVTMAGGIPLEPRPDNQKRPEITVRLYRPKDTGRSLLFEAPFEDILSGDEQFRGLKDSDILVIETEQQSRFTWRDLLSFTSTGVSVALLIVRVVNLRQ